MEQSKVAYGVKHQGLVSLLKELASVSFLHLSATTPLITCFVLCITYRYTSPTQAELKGGDQAKAVHMLEEALEIAETRQVHTIPCTGV